jgi:hypothetical protein
LRQQWRAEAEAAGVDMERHDRITSTPPAYMLGTLAHLRAQYGGVPGYVQAIGVDAAMIETLQNRLIKK